MISTDKNHFWLRFSNIFRSHRKAILIIASVLIFLTTSTLVCVFLINRGKNTSETIQPTAEQPIAKVEPVKYYSTLTGSLVKDEAESNQAVTGVMIENSPEARPQSGLKEAGVVFEAICEGGITRFLALFQSEKPQLVGPVRSVRMYYISWATAFDASIAHVGGNIDALAEIENGNHRDIDQFFNGDSYWRSSDRWAPHNVYTSFEKLDELNASKGYTTSSFTGFSRVDGKPAEKPDATNINITISSELFNSSYIYDTTTNTYARSQAGEPHLDRESGQITPNVVVAMHVNENTIVVPDGYEEQIETVGSGNATIFQNGTATNVTWAKASDNSQIIFTDATGAEIPLVRGQTWIIAVPNGSGDVSWS